MIILLKFVKHALTEEKGTQAKSRRTFFSVQYVRRIIQSRRRRMCFISPGHGVSQRGWFFTLPGLTADRRVWEAAGERSGAVCRLPVRKLSLLAAYVTRHTFGCVSHVGSHPIFHTVCGMRRRQADFLERHSGSSWLHIKLVDLFCCIVQSFCFHGFSKVMMHDIFIVTNIVHLWSAMVNKTEFKLFGE